jgi:heterodisulfide reductase subunit A2
MTDAGRHPRITIHTLSEVADIKGYVGSFEVKIVKKARYVDEKECTACGECAKVCPVVRPDEFNIGLSSRRAIYSPFPQAVPSAYVLNPQECLGNNPVVCSKCLEACEKKCIDFHMSDQTLDVRVGTIVVATGLAPHDPRPLDEYGYTRFENVLTSLEFERLVNAGGPTQGRWCAPPTAGTPNRWVYPVCGIAFGPPRQGLLLQHLLHEHREKHPGAQGALPGHGRQGVLHRHPRLRQRVRRSLHPQPASGRALCARPAGQRGSAARRRLRVAVENTAGGSLEYYELDMLVLATGIEPAPSTQKLQEMLGLQLSTDGFFLEAHPKLQPVDAATRGIFYAGCAEGPKDIRESVTQASAAAVRAIRLMQADRISGEAITSEIDPELCKSCGKCAEVCPYNAITVDTKKKTPAQVATAACSGCGTCAAECAFGAITMHHFTDVQIGDQIDTCWRTIPATKS